jgi:hypothetical protein
MSTASPSFGSKQLFYCKSPSKNSHFYLAATLIISKPGPYNFYQIL